MTPGADEADLQRDAPLPELDDEQRVLRCADAMADAVGPPDRQSLPDGGRAAFLAGMVHRCTPAAAASSIVAANGLSGWSSAGEADGDDTAIAIPAGEVQRAAEPLHRTPPGVVEDHAHFDAGRRPTFCQPGQIAHGGSPGSPTCRSRGTGGG